MDVHGFYVFYKGREGERADEGNNNEKRKI